MNVAAPRLILEDKEPLLLTLLQVRSLSKGSLEKKEGGAELSSGVGVQELEQHKESVAEWSRQGSLCLDYLKVQPAAMINKHRHA